MTEAWLDVYYYYEDGTTSGGLAIGAYQVLNSWSESALTWNTASVNTNMGLSTTQLSRTTLYNIAGNSATSPETASFDVTDAVASWYVSSSAYGIALKYASGTNDYVSIMSYEAGSSTRAYFTITYTEATIEGGVYRLKNVSTGLYMSVQNAGNIAGTPVIHIFGSF